MSERRQGLFRVVKRMGTLVRGSLLRSGCSRVMHLLSRLQRCAGFRFRSRRTCVRGVGDPVLRTRGETRRTFISGLVDVSLSGLRRVSSGRRRCLRRLVRFLNK